jgi:glycosyltransferase involved in cell wall biosynthesis
MKKLAVICAKGLDNFLDWIEPLKPFYDVRLFPVTNEQELNEATLWAGPKGILWLEWCNDVAVYVTNQARKSMWDSRRIIIRLHSYEVFERYPKQVAWDKVNDIVFVADHVKDIFTELQGKLPDKVKTHVIPNGVDIDNIKLVEDRDPHQIAVVGSINYKKNPQMVLQIINQLTIIRGAYKIEWAGAYQDLRYKVYLENMLKEMGIEYAVKFYGHIEDMNAFWQGKGALLHTSIHEGHSYAIMEAMARGIPVFIHNFRGARDLYPAHQTFNSVQEAVEEIIDFLNYEGMPPLEGQKARNYVIKKGWTLKAQVENIKAMLEV